MSIGLGLEGIPEFPEVLVVIQQVDARDHIRVQFVDLE
jgi:hypothetical protein